jgi:ribose 5-phosphate isomerase A
MTDADGQKRDAAHAAVERFVGSGATIGLGSGTTSAFVVRRIGELLEGGELRDVRGIPTSEGTAALAREVGVPTVSLAEARPTLTLDGADEIGPGLACVKGLELRYFGVAELPEMPASSRRMLARALEALEAQRPGG